MEENKGYSTVDACAVHCFTTATHTLSTVIRGQTMFIYIDTVIIFFCWLLALVILIEGLSVSQRAGQLYGVTCIPS